MFAIAEFPFLCREEGKLWNEKDDALREGEHTIPTNDTFII